MTPAHVGFDTVIGYRGRNRGSPVPGKASSFSDTQTSGISSTHDSLKHVLQVETSRDNARVKGDDKTILLEVCRANVPKVMVERQVGT